MPVRVHVPVSMRLSQGRRLAPVDLADLEIGTGDALARAFDTVREDVLTARGRERFVAVGDASLSFTDDVDEALRADLELAVRRAVGYAVDRSDLSSWYRPVALPAAVAGTPGEQVDPTRRADGTYRIPMFDDGTRVETYTFEEGSTITAAPLTSRDVAELAWEAHRERFGAVWDPGAYGYPGWYGLFAHDGVAQPPALLYIYSVDGLDEDGWPINGRFQFGDFSLLRYDQDGDRIVRDPLYPAMGHWVMTRTEESLSYENLLARAESHAERVPEDLRDAAEARQRISRYVADVAAANPGVALYTLEDGSRIVDLVLRPGDDDGGIAHSPIRFAVQGALPGTGEEAEGSGGEREGAGREGEGTGARGRDAGDGADGRGDGRGGHGRRRGPRGGPLGTAEGHGTVWPTVALGGEPLVCEPFLGEPPVEQLAVGGEALAAEMRDIAATLEIDYCGYPGKLCLNLAKLIGARAHAVGITSINSTITTAVTPRPDGGGNNGFVDVRPGSAPELQYMEALGDQAVRVLNLANDISRTYLARPNQHLVHWDADREFDPNPAAWSLRFWIELAEALPHSCMWLYAETCRILLLQQLRSSHAGISARQEQFDETHRRFDEALGILGETVVKLSVLKQAIAHGRRLRITGSVREVLSRRPPPRRYRGEEYEIPAPAESMSSRIFEVLEGATVERQGGAYVARYDGKAWTTEDLDQGVGLRRSLLNLVDPLFNQVENLDRLYHRFRSDPASSGTYLRDLLAEMREANEEMTRQASDWKDGAFFALEASQWVEAEGGISSLGLKYELQGIHKLADDVLRPWVGGIDAYREGVNRAIGIKANWDRFKQRFAVAGVIVLGLLCAPLGVVAVGLVTGVAGLALTLDDIAEAERKEALYRSLEDPEAIIAWQDVQLARLMADLAIAFSIFDVIGVGRGVRAVATGARSALRELVEGGLQSAVRATVGATRRTILANVADEVLRQAVRQAVQQAVIVTTMHAVLPVVITPVLVPWIRGVALEHGSLHRVDAALGELTAGQPEAPAAVSGPLPTEFVLPEDLDEGADDSADPREPGAPEDDPDADAGTYDLVGPLDEGGVP